MKIRKYFCRVTAATLALALVMILTGIEVFADTSNAKNIDYNRYDAIYQEAFERWNMWNTPLQTIYEEYGAMNGDYYRIALEGVILVLNGNEEISPMIVNAIHDQLTENGKIAMQTRKGLRALVSEYGLDESLLPDDPDFAAQPTESPKFSSGSNSGGIADSELLEMIQWEHEHAETRIPNPTETPAPVVNTGFADVSPDAWYADAVAAMVEAGLLKGKDDGLFHPDDIITIAEWCTLLHRVTYKNANKYEGGIIFGNEHYDHWAAYQVVMATSNGLSAMTPALDVYPEGGDVYNAIAQRGEAITGVVRILEWMERGDINGSSVTSARIVMGDGSWTWDDIPDSEEVCQGAEPRAIRTTTAGEPFKDVASTHFWNPQDILNAYNLGIINGVDSNGTCNPTGSMTRAQACKMLYEAGLARCVELFGSASGGIF